MVSKLVKTLSYIHPNDSDALAVRARALFLTNDLQSSRTCLESSLWINPAHLGSSTLFQRLRMVEKLKEEGNRLFLDANYSESVKTYTKTLEIIGQNDEEGRGGHIRSVLLSNRAVALLKAGRLGQAYDDTVAALDLQPTAFKALRTQGRVRLAQGYYDEAVAIFKSALDSSMRAWSVAEGKSIMEELTQAEVILRAVTIKDHHAILGIPRGAVEMDIKKAYRRASLLYHPDKGGNPEHFKLVLEAYTSLMNCQAGDPD